jgi:hypothetical protein
MQCNLSHDSGAVSQAEQVAQHKKVKQWILNLAKFCWDIEAEKKQHPGKCIYHLSRSHPTTECSVKKEWDKLLTEKKDYFFHWYFWSS